MNFGQKLRSLREEKHITQQELAEKLGYVTNSYVSDVEKGQFIPSEANLKKIAKVFNSPLARLKDLLLESKLEEMGIKEPAFVSMFKDYPRLTKREKEEIIKTYLKIKEKKNKR
jgi:transcriptional regulator with XRE-family HTH domain